MKSTLDLLMKILVNLLPVLLDLGFSDEGGSWDLEYVFLCFFDFVFVVDRHSCLSKWRGKAQCALGTTFCSKVTSQHFRSIYLFLVNFSLSATLINTFSFWATPFTSRTICLSSALLQYYWFAICLQLTWIWEGVCLWKLFYLSIWVNGICHHGV